MSRLDIGDVRGVLGMPPSEHTFAQLCEIVGERGELSDELRVYLESSLARWPAKIERPMPKAWRAEFAKGNAVPALVLCNVFRLDWWRWFRAKAPVERLRNVVRMGLQGSGFERASTFAGAPRALTWLSLSACSISDEQVASLLSLSSMRSLEELDLSGCGVGPSALDALARSKSSDSLRVLDVRGCRIGAEGAAMLATSPAFSGLERLYVDLRDVGGEGARVIAASTTLSSDITDAWDLTGAWGGGR